MFAPIARSISQLDDPAFRGVLFRSIAWSIACFGAVDAAAIWGVHRILELHGLLAWGADIIGSIGASLLALWFFLPVAAAIGVMYLDRIARSVDQRFYPWLPQPNGASMMEQAWDGAAVAAKVLAFNIVALLLAWLLPGVGLIPGWMIASYAVGRGLFNRGRDAADAASGSGVAVSCAPGHRPATGRDFGANGISSDHEPVDSGHWDRCDGPRA